MAAKRARPRGDADGGSYKRKRRSLVDEEAHLVIGRAQSYSDLSPRLRTVGILTSGGDSQGVFELDIDSHYRNDRSMDHVRIVSVCDKCCNFISERTPR